MKEYCPDIESELHIWKIRNLKFREQYPLMDVCTRARIVRGTNILFCGMDHQILAGQCKNCVCFHKAGDPID